METESDVQPPDQIVVPATEMPPTIDFGEYVTRAGCSPCEVRRRLMILELRCFKFLPRELNLPAVYRRFTQYELEQMTPEEFRAEVVIVELDTRPPADPVALQPPPPEYGLIRNADFWTLHFQGREYHLRHRDRIITSRTSCAIRAVSSSSVSWPNSTARTPASTPPRAELSEQLTAMTDPQLEALALSVSQPRQERSHGRRHQAYRDVVQAILDRLTAAQKKPDADEAPETEAELSAAKAYLLKECGLKVTSKGNIVQLHRLNEDAQKTVTAIAKGIQRALATQTSRIDNLFELTGPGSRRDEHAATSPQAKPP